MVVDELDRVLHDPLFGRIVFDVSSTVQRREVYCDPFKMAAERIRDNRQVVLARLYRALEQLFRTLPRNWVVKTALALAQHRFADAVWVVS